MSKKMTRRGNIITIVILIAIMLFSFFILAKALSNPETFRESTQYLDDKKMTVAELATAATAASAAISLIPGDAGQPIANKLTDLSGYFIAIFTAIYVEKLLITISGFITFKILIPVACLLLIVFICIRSPKLKNLAIRLIALGLVLFLIVPVSVNVSKIIETANDNNIQMTIQNAQDTSNDITENATDENGAMVAQIISMVKGGVSGQLEKFEAILSDMLDSIAVLLVTSCIIPVVVLLVLWLIIKMLFGIQYEQIEDIKKIKGLRSHNKLNTNIAEIEDK